MILVSADPSMFEPRELEPSELEKREVVFLPPTGGAASDDARASPGRRAAPGARPPRPAPGRPQDPSKKDRISVGPPSEVRQKGPMILRREDDLTKVPKGQPTLPPQVAPAPSAPKPTPGPQTAQRGGETPETPGRQGLRLPPGLDGTARRPRATTARGSARRASARQSRGPSTT